MKDKHRTKFVTKDIFKSSVIGAFTKLNPKYMMHNPVMFVVEIGFVIALLLSIFPELFGPTDGINNVRLYNIFVCVILFVTVLFANFAEAVAEGRGKAQAESLKKTQKDTKARLLHEDGTQTIVSSSELKKGDVVLVSAGEIIPNDGEVIEGTASVDESAITGESAPVLRESGGDFASVTGVGHVEFLDGEEKLAALTALMRHMAGREDQFTEQQARTVEVFAVRADKLSAKAKVPHSAQ